MLTIHIVVIVLIVKNIVVAQQTIVKAQQTRTVINVYHVSVVQLWCYASQSQYSQTTHTHYREGQLGRRTEYAYARIVVGEQGIPIVQTQCGIVVIFSKTVVIEGLEIKKKGMKTPIYRIVWCVTSRLRCICMAKMPSNFVIYASKPQYKALYITIGNTGSKWCIYCIKNQDFSVDKGEYIVYTVQYNMRITERVV